MEEAPEWDLIELELYLFNHFLTRVVLVFLFGEVVFKTGVAFKPIRYANLTYSLIICLSFHFCSYEFKVSYTKNTYFKDLQKSPPGTSTLLSNAKKFPKMESPCEIQMESSPKKRRRSNSNQEKSCKSRKLNLDDIAPAQGIANVGIIDCLVTITLE